MNVVKIIREVMKEKEISQARLAEIAGFRGQSNITGILNNSKGNVRVGNLYRIMDALGYEIVIRNKLDHESAYTVEYSSEELEELKPKRKVEEQPKPKKRKKKVDLDNLLSE